MHVLSLMLALVLATSSAGAGETVPDPMREGLSARERLDSLVARVKLEQNRIETMSARFIRDQDSQLLLEPERSEGLFHYRAPDAVRWEYRKPHPMDTLILGEEMLTHFKDLGKAERYSIGEYSEQVFEYLGARGSLDTLMKYFRVVAEFPETEGERYHLILLPLYKGVQRKLKRMELWLDSVTYLPVHLLYVLPNGDLTEFRFEDVVLNEPLPQDVFDLELPEGTEVREVSIKKRS